MAEIDETIARNGSHGGGVATAEPEGAPEVDEEGPVAAADAVVTDETDETDETAGTDDAAPVGDDDATPVGAAAMPATAAATEATDVTPGFLSELSGAMRSVLGRERERIAAVVRDDAAAHAASAQAHSTAEAEAFREIADADVATMEAWADGEIERIRTEAAGTAAARQADLAAHLAQHDAVLDSELQGIDAAVTEYEATLGAYLDDLDATDDPAEIAQRARAMPRPPDLDTVRSMARADALTRLAEQSMEREELVAVMDPAATAEPAWPAPEDGTAVEEAAFGHSSAAVRLLRSVAPWTAPNHAADPDTEHQA